MGTKPILKSQTIWGAIITAIPLVLIILQSFGVEVTADEANGVVDNLDNIVAGIAGIIGIINVVIGRKNAHTELSGLV